MEYPNPARERGTILQVPHLRIGLRLVVLTSPLAFAIVRSGMIGDLAKRLFGFVDRICDRHQPSRFQQFDDLFH